jgi:hypothetical protein
MIGIDNLLAAYAVGSALSAAMIVFIYVLAKGFRL